MTLMSLFDRWKKKTISDPVFGSLTYQRVGFWEGFLPLGGRDVPICVEADEEGPRAHQRQTAEFVQRGFDALMDIARTSATPATTAELKLESASFEPEEGAWEVVLISDEDSLYRCIRFEQDRPAKSWADG